MEKEYRFSFVCEDMEPDEVGDKINEEMEKRGFEHLFDDPDSCINVYATTERRLDKCLSFWWKDNRVWQAKIKYFHGQYEIDEVSIEVTMIDKIDVDEWCDYWLVMLREYSPSDIKNVAEAYGRNFLGNEEISLDEETFWKVFEDPDSIDLEPYARKYEKKYGMPKGLVNRAEITDIDKDLKTITVTYYLK